jgi:NarL family two-component system response regulator LiaR
MELTKAERIPLKPIFLYGFILAALMLVLKWFQWQFLVKDTSLETYLGLIALFFTALGIWIATQLIKPKVRTVVVEKEVHPPSVTAASLDEAELKKLNLSDREYEVLQLLTQGCSNAEIGAKLFLSVSTIKTHVSNLFQKMDVKSRLQAVEKAKRLRIVP